MAPGRGGEDREEERKEGRKGDGGGRTRTENGGVGMREGIREEEVQGEQARVTRGGGGGERKRGGRSE